MMKIVLVLYAAMLVVCTCEKDLPAAEIQSLLMEADKFNDLYDVTEVIVFIGKTGTGKSSLLKFLLRDESLVLEESGRNTVFSDNNQTISSSNQTQASKTIYPRIGRDSKTGIVLADCPGFGDTRSTKVEIITSYFIKKVLESAQQIKIILVENHFILSDGNHRTGITDLLEHLAELIPNSEHFRGSVGLVATKVEMNAKKLSDESEIHYIIEYLKSSKKFIDDQLQKNSNNPQQDIKPWRKMSNVLNVLLGDFSGNNIALFRRPVEVGNPWNSELMLNNYESLRKMAFNSLNFARNEKGIFQYTLTSASKLHIETWLRDYDDTLEKIFQNFTSDFKISFFKRIEQITDITSKRKIISFLEQKLTTIDENFKSLSYLPDIIQDLWKEKLIQMCQPSFIDKVRNYTLQTEFFYSVVGKDLNSIIRKIKDIFREQITKILKKYDKLNKYFELVEDGLLQYEIQHQRQKIYSNIESFTDKTHFKELILALSDMKINASLTSYILNTDITEKYFEEIRDLLKYNLIYSVNDKLIGSKLCIDGHNIIFSEIKSILGKYTKYSEVNLFAYNYVYIDEYLLLEDVHLNIMAPYIYVAKQVEIKLAGAKVEDFVSKAPKSNSRIYPGTDGRAGIPGSNSRNLLIASLEIFHREWLTISSIGGDGGRGEDGGDGFDGIASSIPKVNEMRGYKDDIISSVTSMGYTTNLGRTDIRKNRPYVFVFVNYIETFDAFILEARNEQGNVLPTMGGNGGRGGIGGSPGNIVIIANNVTNIKIYKKEGNRGENGKGGKGGMGAARCALKYLHCFGSWKMIAVLSVPAYIQNKMKYHCDTRSTQNCYDSFCDKGSYCDKYSNENNGDTGTSDYHKQDKKIIEDIIFADDFDLYKELTRGISKPKYNQNIDRFVDFVQNQKKM